MSQLNIVKQQLLDTGKVSRNWCLQQRITRLAAIIAVLKNEMEIYGKSVGGDYVYYIQKREREDIKDPDGELREMIKNTPVTWENQEKLRQLQDALKSKDDYRKRGVVLLYS